MEYLKNIAPTDDPETNKQNLENLKKALDFEEELIYRIAEVAALNIDSKDPTKLEFANTSYKYVKTLSNMLNLAVSIIEQKAKEAEGK